MKTLGALSSHSMTCRYTRIAPPTAMHTSTPSQWCRWYWKGPPNNPAATTDILGQFLHKNALFNVVQLEGVVTCTPTSTCSLAPSRLPNSSWRQRLFMTFTPATRPWRTPGRATRLLTTTTPTRASVARARTHLPCAACSR